MLSFILSFVINGVIYLDGSVPVNASAEVALIAIFCSTIFVPSYMKSYVQSAAMSPFAGSVPSTSLIDFTPGQKSTLQAPVFAVVNLARSLCPVVYAPRTGVRATT